MNCYNENEPLPLEIHALGLGVTVGLLQVRGLVQEKLHKTTPYNNQ